LETPDNQDATGAVTGGPCADDSAPVAGFGAGHGCQDIFVLSGALINPAHQIVSAPFALPGDPLTLYQVTLTLGGFGPLNAAACTAAGALAGCQGFLTDESASNSLHPAFGITSHIFTVPEPATLGLLGIGLIGLAGAVRIRRK
jgi:hypothetical protein